MAKNVGYGSVMVVCSTSDGIAENKVAFVRSISGPGVSGNDIDTTTLDSSSNYRTFVAGLLDPGEVTAALVYDPTDASHKRLARYMKNRITANFKICEVSTGGSVSSFTGYIKAMSREIPMDDVITCDVTFKVSGLPGYTT
jgi:predicted secreted protein